MQRRDFLATLGAAGAGSILKATTPPAALESKRITLLHTNDTHSHIEPFGPGNGSLSGKGGIARRATLVKRLRAEVGASLLLDAGDTFQGTPYFNLYKGKLDYQLMRMAGYDATTLGNHDFDNGVDMLVAAIEAMEALNHPHPPFALINCNFDFAGAPKLGAHVRPWMVRTFPGLRVGITGVGVAFAGLVAEKNHEGVGWRDPYESLKPVVRHLREQERVDLVVVLSHLGYQMDGNFDDLRLPAHVPGVDAVIGGHSHTFLDTPTRLPQAQGETLVFQVGFGGVNLGRMDFAVARGEVRASGGSSTAVEG